MESNDEQRFVSHYIRHECAIRSFILTIVPSAIDVDEIHQEASVKMWQRFEQFTEGTSFRNWAFQVAKYTALNHIRRVQRDRHVFTNELVGLLAADVETHSNELVARRTALEHCVSKLVEGDRHVLSNCYSANQSIKDFADREKRTSNAVYKQLDRIRRDLLRCVRSLNGSLSPS